MSPSPARLYATTGTSFVRLDEGPDGWTPAHALPDSGAQCLAVDPSDPDVVYVGLAAGGVRKTTDGGETWSECGLADEQVFSVAVSAADGAVYAGTEPSALYRSDDGGLDLERAHGPARAPFASDVELSPEAVDVARPLDRARSARRGRAPRRDRARRTHALDRRRRDLAGPPARRAPRRPLPRLASARPRPRVRGGRRAGPRGATTEATRGRRATRGGSATTRGP